MKRRDWLARTTGGLGAAWALGAGLEGCSRPGGAADGGLRGLGFDALPGGWVGAALDRGHRLREAADGAGPALAPQRCDVLIVGAGIAGLAAAHALRAAGVEDLAVLDLEDRAGGNSRGHVMGAPTAQGALRCPLGAHYLPLPVAADGEVAQLLGGLGLVRVEGGRLVADERYLCHSPQERLYIDGAWHDGLLPAADDDAPLLAQYRRFAAAVAEVQRTLGFALPTGSVRWQPGHAALDAQTFAAWLDAAGLDHPRLRWYLDYCCRDDYGAGADQVSAWAGLHYFASRHGFHAPGEEAAGEPVLTWPEGNAWLAERLAAPLGDRLRPGRLARSVQLGREGASVDVEVTAGGRPAGAERWQARQLVLAVPGFVAARLLGGPGSDGPDVPAPLAALRPRWRHSPWLVTNLQLDRPLIDRPGAPPSWDNVVMPEPDDPWGAVALGYVDAQHQSLRPVPGPTVLTVYWALGGGSAAQAAAWRQALRDEPWTAWAARVLAPLVRLHPDLPRRLQRVDLMRYGHAMSVPVPGLRGDPALAALARPQGRLHLAHADLSGYSVFEEAWSHGLRAGREAAAALRR